MASSVGRGRSVLHETTVPTNKLSRAGSQGPCIGGANWWPFVIIPFGPRIRDFLRSVRPSDPAEKPRGRNRQRRAFWPAAACGSRNTVRSNQDRHTNLGRGARAHCSPGRAALPAQKAVERYPSAVLVAESENDVVEGVRQKATQVCGAAFGIMNTYDGERFRTAAVYRFPPCLGSGVQGRSAPAWAS